MNTISILEKTKTYVIVKIPQRLMKGFHFDPSPKLTEAEALKILRAGMTEHRQGKTSKLGSLRELRHGN